MREETIAVPGWGGEPDAAPGGARQPGDLTPELIATDWWTDQMVAQAGIPVVDVPFVSVGGGIGSLVMVDYLRIAGVPTSAIKVLTTLESPWDSYEYLTKVSQIPRGERLRSDSGSTPDNIWGFPSYAVREAFSARSVGGFFRPLWQVLVEPIFDDYYTPRAGQAFETMERERDRIGFGETVVRGQVRMVRRRVGGGYFTVLTPPEGASRTRRVAFRSSHVHLAVGYPGLRYLPDLQRYREQHRDYSNVVNSYEPHEQVYQRLRTQPGTVMVRGGGIVASRVLQRLMDDRAAYGLQTQIVHLFRTYVSGPQHTSWFLRRNGGDGWAYQGFNWPKSIWGGQTKSLMRRVEGRERAELHKILGGTTTPKRRLWQRQMAQGRREGWYRTMIGEIDDMVPGPGGTVTIKVKTDHGVQEGQVTALIDCTGLEADITEHRVLADLLEHGGAGRNPVGRLDVEPHFEVRGTRSGPGKIYASGSATLGGYFPAVDSFLGLQYAALEIADDLARIGFCRRIGVGTSLRHWWKWVRGKRI
jgi:hypothetical protein